MGAIDHLPEKLIQLSSTARIRSVFIRSGNAQLWRPEDFDIELHPGERIINVETIPPNPAIGAGTRVWIELPII